MPPRPDTSDAPPFAQPLNILLDDVQTELLVMLCGASDEEKRTSKNYQNYAPAMPEFLKLLGSAYCRVQLCL